MVTRGLTVQSGRCSPSKSPASSSGPGVEHGTCQSQKGWGQLHAFVDNILCPYKPDYSATHHNRPKCNGEICNRYILLPITSIDDVPIMASIIVTVRIEEVQHINGDISKQDVININGDISSPSLCDEEGDNLEYYRFCYSYDSFEVQWDKCQ